MVPSKEELSIVWVWKGQDVRGMGCVIGQHVLTAAHCIPRAPNAMLPGDDPVMVEIAPLRKPEHHINLFVMGYEPCVDVAILGTSTRNGEDVPEEHHARFHDLLTEIEEAEAELRLDLKLISPNASEIRLRWLDFQQEWASSKLKEPPALFHIGFHMLLDKAGSAGPGTSGSPIFSAPGKVIGILNQGLSSPNDPEYGAMVVYLKNALPGWFLLQHGQDRKKVARWIEALMNREKK